LPEFLQEFAGADRSKVSLIPVAYDGTSTWGKGADKGPEAFLDAAENMELYDIETGTEVYKEGIYLHQTLEGFTTPDAMVEAVYAKFKDQYTRGKLGEYDRWRAFGFYWCDSRHG
jgi:agmatinase